VFTGAHISAPLVAIPGLLLAGYGAFRLARARRRTWRCDVLFLMASIILGLALGVAFWSGEGERAQRVATLISERPQERQELTVLEDPRQGAISMTSLATLAVAGAGDMRVRVFWDSGKEPLPLGTRFSARVAFKPLTEKQGFLHRQGVFGSVSLESIELEGRGFSATPLGLIYAFREHNQHLLAAVGNEGSVLLRGVLLGDTTELDQIEAGRAFRVTGLSHLVAVSGSHLVVIALLITWLIGRLRLKRSIEVVLVTLLLVAYVLLTGLQPSAIRACVMAFIASTATFVGRRSHIPSALATAAIAMLALFPPATFSVGFWLSVFAVFGLTIFCPLIMHYLVCLVGIHALESEDDSLDAGAARCIERNRRQARWVRRLGRVGRHAIVDPLALTMTAQMATLPITAPLFATISLVSPFANLLVTPLITLLVGAGIAALCLMPLLGPLGPLILGCLCGIANLSIALAIWCAQLPHACVPVSANLTLTVACALLAAALIYRLWPQPSRKRGLLTVGLLALSFLLLFAGTLLPVPPQVVMLDVGQGDAILVREGRSNILIDTGQSDTTLLRALAHQRVGHLNAVIITHLDEDHSGALDALSGTVPVDHIFVARGLLEAQPTDAALSSARLALAGGEPEELARGDTIRLGPRIELVMLLPSNAATKGKNEESICLGLFYDDDGDGEAESRVLLVGDAESPQLAPLFTDATDASAQRFDVLKVGHHGSKDAVTALQLEKMHCQLALISAGRDNRYGHPSADTLEVLDQAGVTVYRTDLNGDVTMRFEDKSILVRCDTMTEVS
jgi:competence protein ComEC